VTFALTYDECRARFRRAADAAGVRCEAHRIEARGPESQALSLDVRTVTDLSRILAERSEHWLHRRYDLSAPRTGPSGISRRFSISAPA
jgi:hypothetical protein